MEEASQPKLKRQRPQHYAKSWRKTANKNGGETEHLVKQVLIVRRKITFALDRDDLLEAQELKKQLSELKLELSSHKVCAVCWMPVPSQYSLDCVPERWYFDAFAARCAYCGKDCSLPPADGLDSDHQNRGFTSLKYRAGSEMTLARKHFVTKFAKYKEHKRSIPKADKPLGQGKGVRLRREVPIKILIGSLHRTLQRIRVEDDLEGLVVSLENTLSFMGFY